MNLDHNKISVWKEVEYERGSLQGGRDAAELTDARLRAAVEEDREPLPDYDEEPGERGYALAVLAEYKRRFG